MRGYGDKLRFMMGQVPKPETLLTNETKKLFCLDNALASDAASGNAKWSTVQQLTFELRCLRLEPKWPRKSIHERMLNGGRVYHVFARVEGRTASEGCTAEARGHSREV